MRRYGVGHHALDVGARRTRELGVLAVLVHAAGLVRQRAAGVRHDDLQIRVPFHEAGKNQPRRRHAHLDDAAETELQRAAIAFQIVAEDRVGGMKEKRDAELFDAGVERRQALGIDARIAADASRKVDAHQPELFDRVIQYVDSDFRIDQRHRGAGPDAAGISLLRARHLFVPHQRGIAAFFLGQIGEIDRERSDGGDHAHLVAKAIHVFELAIEVEPLGPAVERRAPLLPHIIIATAAVDLSRRIARAPAKAVEDFSRPPVEMGIDDTHGVCP